MHYKADYVSPSWAKAKDEIKSPNVNNEPLKTTKPMHQFYKLEWDCAIDATNRTIKAPSATASLSPGFLFLFGEPAYAISTMGDWEIVNFKGRGNFLRMKSRPLIQLEIATDPLGAKIESVKTLTKNKNVQVITFTAGEFGTSQILKVQRAALYHTVSRKFLGSFPVSYSEDGKLISEQPEWITSTAELRIYDPQSGSTDVVEFKD